MAQRGDLPQEDNHPPLKRVKRECKYQTELRKNGVLPSKKGSTFALCEPCGIDINIGHGGLNDVKKHLATVKHQEMLKAASSTKNLKSFFRLSPVEESITRAEVLFANFIAEHNLPFMLADHFTHLARAMFPDSQVAKGFRCAATKTTCIVKGALSPYFSDPVTTLCRETPFSILCDEGSDTDRHNFTILVRMWDENLGKPMTRFLDMPICNAGNAASLFEQLDTVLESKAIPWCNVVGFESDTANVMIGKHNSVLSRVKTKQPGVFSQGCVCHLANLCLLQGIKCLPLDVDDFFVDLFYYFDKSFKRKEELHEFQDFTGTQQLKILKHCKTRWLSLERPVKRVLQQWQALLAYFDKESEEDKSARVQRLNKHLKSPLTKLFMHFLQYSLEFLCRFNTVFQSNLAMLPSLKVEVLRLLRVLLGKFIAAASVPTTHEGINEINLNDPAIQLADSELGIGHEAWSYLSEEEDFFDPGTLKIFFNGVREYYKAVTTTVLKKFSFNDHVFDDVTVLLPENRSDVSSAAVIRLAKRFSAAAPPDIYDALEEEVLDYKLSAQSEFPELDREGKECIENHQICSYWQCVGELKTLCGAARFPHLSRLSKCLLALPVSNAETERIFSIVRKIVTDYRSQMDQSTLCALISCKVNNDTVCFQLDTPTSLLKEAKSATVKYNLAHSSTVV